MQEILRTEGRRGRMRKEEVQTLVTGRGAAKENNKMNDPSQKKKKKSEKNSTINALNAFDIIQHPFMIIILNKLAIERHSNNLIEIIL